MIDEKISKYFVYALGEIVLVIIGILIALSVNNRNQQRIEEGQVKRILIEIQKDILMDIDQSEQIIQIHMIRDFMKNLNLKNRFPSDKIRLAKDALGNLHLSFFLDDHLVLQNNGYNQLVQKIEGLPNKYVELMTELNQLNGYSRKRFEESGERYRETVTELINYAYANTSWYAKDRFTGELSDEAIDFLANDEAYKKFIMKQCGAASAVFSANHRYRNRAIEVFMMIKELLGDESLAVPETISSTTLQDAQEGSKFVGTYELAGGPENNF